MKIVQLDIQGFRSLKSVSWRPGDLNVVIGPNGSGKSNLLRVLELTSASVQGQLSKYIQSSGGINAVLWDGEAQTIAFDFSFDDEEMPFGQNLIYGVEIAQTIFGDSYSFQREVLARTDIDPFRLERGAGGTTLDYRNLRWNFPENSLIGSETMVSMMGDTLLTAGPTNEAYDSLNNPISWPKRDLATWLICQDIVVGRASAIRQSALTKYETLVTADGQNLISVLHTLYSNDRKFKQDINDAMSAAFGADFDELIFPPAADQRIQMRVRWKTLKREQSTADLSDGTLRFLFLMTVLASPNPPPLIAIDEPETGLHPSMLPIIAEFAVEAATRTQVIFTTHSDQFLSAFRDTKPTVTIAKWENGETTLTTVEDSELAYWVKDYSLGKLFRSGELENLAS